MVYENNEPMIESVYSKKIRAGKRRTYFFDVRATRSNDYFLTITESRKRFNDNGYDRHKIFLYKEDFNKFVKGLNEAVNYVKTDLMPDFDFDAFNHENYADGITPTAHGDEAEMAKNSEVAVETFVEAIAPDNHTEVATETAPSATEEVDKW